MSDDREYLIYEMTFTSDVQTAMILPIPVASNAVQGALEFVALDNYPSFFRDLETHFKDVWLISKTLAAAPQAVPKVHLVGAFEASFVPSSDHFDQLDQRFSISPEIWKQLPGYASFGFVVFKLQPGKHVNVHPMAFSFRTRHPDKVFFPTVHIHDGMLHDTATFDHVLYTQNKPASLVSRTEPPFFFWMPSEVSASQYLRTGRTCGLVDPAAPCFQAPVYGDWRNSDILVPISTR